MFTTCLYFVIINQNQTKMKQKKNKIQNNRSPKRLQWSEGILSHFRFEANYISKDEIKKNIDTFVDLQCNIEGKTNEEVALDLFNQVYNIDSETNEDLSKDLFCDMFDKDLKKLECMYLKNHLTYESVLSLSYGDTLELENGSYLYHYSNDDHIVYVENDEEIFCILLDHKNKSLTFETL